MKRKTHTVYVKTSWQIALGGIINCVATDWEELGDNIIK